MGEKLYEAGSCVNNWIASHPQVGGVRPVRCPHCGRGCSRAGQLGMHGHGSRERAVIIDGEDGGKPVEAEVMVRRYLCRDCGRVCTVGPRHVLTRRRNDRVRIAVVLVLWAAGNRPLSGLREEYSPRAIRGASDQRDWPMVRRWVREAVRIFGQRCTGRDGPVRSVAKRIAVWILAHEPPGHPGRTLAERAACAVCSGAF